MDKLFAEAESSLITAVIDFSLLPLDVIDFYAAIRAIKHLPKIKKIISSPEKIVEFIKSSKLKRIRTGVGGVKSAKKLDIVVKLLGKNGAAKMDNFFIYLAQSSQRLRLRFFNKLKSSNLTPTRLKNIIEKSLEAAKKKGCLL